MNDYLVSCLINNFPQEWIMEAYSAKEAREDLTAIVNTYAASLTIISVTKIEPESNPNG